MRCVKAAFEIAVDEDADSSLRCGFEHGCFLQEGEQVVGRGAGGRQERDQTVAEPIGRLEATVELRQLAAHHIANIAVRVVEGSSDLAGRQAKPSQLNDLVQPLDFDVAVETVTGLSSRGT